MRSRRKETRSLQLLMNRRNSCNCFLCRTQKRNRQTPADGYTAARVITIHRHPSLQMQQQQQKIIRKKKQMHGRNRVNSFYAPYGRT